MTGNSAPLDVAERFRIYIESAAEAFFAHDMNGRFIDVNQRACDSVGYSREELLQMTVCDLEQDFDLPQAQEAWQRIPPGDWRTLAGRHRRKDGRLFPVEARISRHDHAGNPILIGFVQDVSNRKTLEERAPGAARRNEPLRHSLIAINACADLNSVLACLLEQLVALDGLDAGGIYVFENQNAVLRFHRGLPAEFVGQAARRSMDSEYIEWLLANPHEIFNLSERFPEQHRLGAAFGLRHVYSLGLLAEGRPFGYINIVSRAVQPPADGVIERAKILMLQGGNVIERQLAAQRNRAILASMAEGMVTHGADGSIIDCNSRAETILGLSRDEIMGRKPVDPRFRVMRENGQPFPGEEHPAMVSVRTGTTCRDVVMGLNLPDGTRKWININSEPIFKAGRKLPVGSVATFTDITERREIEERSRQAQKLEGIGQLAGGMAHEFNNIFAAMALNIELLRSRPVSEQERETLGGMDSLCRRATDLIKQLLAFSHKSPLHLQAVDLAKTIRTQIEMLAPLLGERIICELTGLDDSVWISADERLMEQVLMNICLNAKEAMKTGGRLRIELAAHEVTEPPAKWGGAGRPGRYACWSVIDQGCGMDKTTQARLFEPFFTTKPVGAGTGLGLATAFGIVKQHHGWMEVESAVGHGSTFRIYLPTIPAPVNTVAEPPVKTASHRGRKVLVVEDEPHLRMANKRFIARLGFETLEAANGDEAWELWQKSRDEIGLVYSDVVMPGELDGTALATKILADRPAMRVILTSGHNDEFLDNEESRKSGIIYFSKPCSLAHLAKTIQECLKPD